jgi:hypothetical protein
MTASPASRWWRATELHPARWSCDIFGGRVIRCGLGLDNSKFGALDVSNPVRTVSVRRLKDDFTDYRRWHKGRLALAQQVERDSVNLIILAIHDRDPKGVGAGAAGRSQ